jgi:uncharacterized protein YcbK (DUF882 family)
VPKANEHVIELRFDGRPGEFFAWAELEVTATGLPNEAPTRVRTCLQILVQRFLDPLRLHLKRPIRINSGYRSDAVNRRVKGSKTSRHMTGEAADIEVDGLDAHAILAAIELADLSYDQVIAYAPSRGGHVHVQICAGAPSRHRKQRLWAPASGGYEPYRQEQA